MLKIPVGQLAEAKENPIAYRSKLHGVEDGAIRRYGYFNALRDSLHRFHKDSSRPELARAYLENQLNQFKNEKKCADTLSSFDWYVEETSHQSNIIARSRQKISIPLPSRVAGILVCSGEVGRIDVRSSGGYSAWMLINRASDGWDDELQMPLIQQAIALELAVVPSEVEVGVFAFVDQLVLRKTYGALAIRRAGIQLDSLIGALGF